MLRGRNGREVAIGGRAPIAVIGQRINPAGHPRLDAELRSGRMDLAIVEGRRQLEAGAAALDVNAALGAADADEPERLAAVVDALQAEFGCPLVLDSADPKALLAALAVCGAAPLVNAVNATADTSDTTTELLTAIAERRASVVASPIGTDGIPPDADGRLQVAATIIDRATAAGISRTNVILDPLVLPIRTLDGRGPDRAVADDTKVELTVIARAAPELGVTTICGVANVSWGLAERSAADAAFAAVAVGAGLDAAILDPLDRRVMAAALARRRP